ncbi:glucosaminidase domain-containing protein [Aestuariibacter sp. AA17]|uniref:Glucosaminidase domain-containing protein n=1 Tax=Fluctibacter corallii TaxID=2984329 RepID=A0ABT3A6B5_9ALTE|nr:glucosaminidase domain-containing protein [Aestuariibacter sp. AA17]MCV2884219.1 glucosaminidase domain-containing protein [Aestuariibacter sp. AA17]
MHNKKRINVFIYLARIAVACGILFIFAYPFLDKETLEDIVVDIAPREEVPDFNRFRNVSDKKRAFFAYLMPAIEKENEAILETRLFLLDIKKRRQIGKTIGRSQQQRLSALAKKYRVKNAKHQQDLVARLLKRVDVVPAELVLAQAANESAWGTSRFAKQGYNFFGLWCFKKGCGFVPRRRGDNANHEVAKFENLQDAVNTYMLNLNRHFAYEELRNIRAALRKSQQKITAPALAQGLLRYSERGQDYIDELIAMIDYNRKYMPQ